MREAALGLENEKLGFLIASWSIPAGETCPGETPTCRKACYAKRHHFARKSVQQRYHKNWLFAQSRQFVRWMTASLRTHFVRVCRIHVAGDFDTPAYIRKWCKIVENSPQVRFFTYTRSWRDPILLPLLVGLSAYPNMDLWWSIDRDTGPAPGVRGIRHAYLAENDADALNAPRCDLIFRNPPRATVLKKVQGTLVCPHENGTRAPITCSTCQVCWTPAASVIPPSRRRALTLVS